MLLCKLLTWKALPVEACCTGFSGSADDVCPLQMHVGCQLLQSQTHADETMLLHAPVSQIAVVHITPAELHESCPL